MGSSWARSVKILKLLNLAATCELSLVTFIHWVAFHKFLHLFCKVPAVFELRSNNHHTFSLPAMHYPHFFSPSVAELGSCVPPYKIRPISTMQWANAIGVFTLHGMNNHFFPVRLISPPTSLSEGETYWMMCTNWMSAFWTQNSCWAQPSIPKWSLEPVLEEFGRCGPTSLGGICGSSRV